MAETQITHDDIEALAYAVDSIALPPQSKALLSTLIVAIRDAIGERETPLTVTVETIPSLQEEFDTAYTADPELAADAAAFGVKVTVAKIGR